MMFMGKLNIKCILNGKLFQVPIHASNYQSGFKATIATGPEGSSCTQREMLS